MDPQTSSRRSQDITKAELERKKRDLYTIYNPTNQSFQVVLNAKISPEVWTILAKDELVVPWYVAEKYFIEMTNKIIYNKSDKAVIEENQKREAKGFAKMDLHTEQLRFEGRNIKNLMGKREQIARILNRGLYQEYGIGQNAEQKVDSRKSRDTFEAEGIFDEPVSPPQVVESPKDPPKPQDTQDEKPEVYISKKDRANDNK